MNFIVFLLGSDFSFHQKDTGNEEISRSTFQKHILVLVDDICEKSYSLLKRVANQENSGKSSAGADFEPG